MKADAAEFVPEWYRAKKQAEAATAASAPGGKKTVPRPLNANVPPFEPSASVKSAVSQPATPLRAREKPPAPWITPPMLPAPTPHGAAPPMALPTASSGDVPEAPALPAPAQPAHSSAALAAVQISMSAEDAKRIGAESRLNSSAAVFVPQGFVPRRPFLETLPPPVSVAEPAQQPADLAFCDTWCLFFDDVKSSQDNFEPYPIYQMTDIPTFWRVIQNIPPVSRQLDGSTYYLFREGILPKWEHVRNAGGGA